MPNDAELETRIDNLIGAFDLDDFEVNRKRSVERFQVYPDHGIARFDVDPGQDVFVLETSQGTGLGIRAHHRTAINYQTRERKSAFYVEGTPWQRGFLVGLMAPESVEKMAVDYVENLPLSIINPEHSPRFWSKIIDLIEDEIFPNWIRHIEKDMPPDALKMFSEEIEGIAAGCRAVDSDTKVDTTRLWTLNVGFDALLAHLYTGMFHGRRGVHPHHLRVPKMCNGFALFGNLTGGKHFLGRDLMFPDVKILQDVACLMIVRPVSRNGVGSYPFISMCTPGYVGSFAGLNSNGVGMGTDMLMTGACSHSRPGFNQEMLLRWVLESATGIENAVDIIAGAKRGVSAIYILGDGGSDRACVLESIQWLDDPKPKKLAKYFLSFAPKHYRKQLPDRDFLERQMEQMNPADLKLLRKGLGVRWNDYLYPEEFQQFNKVLWNRHFHGMKDPIPYPGEDFTNARGFINRYYTDHNCPGMYYFPHQRENLDDLVLATNHAIVPFIRLTEMNHRTELLFGRHSNDIQWRYDALNDQILDEIEKTDPDGSLEEETVKELIDFLAPLPDDGTRHYMCYYDRGQRSSDTREIAVQGSTSVMELKEKTITSHFGYYCDEWVKLTLPRYI